MLETEQLSSPKITDKKIVTFELYNMAPRFILLKPPPTAQPSLETGLLFSSMPRLPHHHLSSKTTFE